MNFLKHIWHLFSHIEDYLQVWTLQYGIGIYALVFTIIFSETGLVIAPFLPGDSLLFALGILCKKGNLQLPIILILLSIASILGDATNYFIGKRFGRRMIQSSKIRILQKKHLDQAYEFYAKHGGKAIMFSRFLPILRTLAPFVAGMGNMPYRSFLFYNILGGVSWVCSFTMLGYLFGNLPGVKKNFSLVIIGIILVSLLPFLYKLLKTIWVSKKSGKSTEK